MQIIDEENIVNINVRLYNSKTDNVQSFCSRGASFFDFDVHNFDIRSVHLYYFILLLVIAVFLSFATSSHRTSKAVNPRSKLTSNLVGSFPTNLNDAVCWVSFSYMKSWISPNRVKYVYVRLLLVQFRTRRIENVKINKIYLFFICRITYETH